MKTETDYISVRTDEKQDQVIKPGSNFDKTKLLNIVLLGIVFMTTGSRTPISIQKTVLYSAKQPNATSYVEGFKGDGYISNSLLYASFALFNFFAPWVIAKLGSKYSMLLGGLGYTAYAAQMLYLSDYLLYTCALLNGLGASLLWTALYCQGKFLSINTTARTSGRDAGIFWSLYQCSGVLGNLAVYLLFQGTDIIRTEVRLQAAATFTGLCVLGLLVILLFRPTPWHLGDSGASVSNPLRSVISCLKLLRTGPMLKLSLTFLYTGLEISFWAGVLPSSVSFTRALGGDRKSLMGLTSVLVSLGSMAGGLLLISLKEVVNKRGRSLVILTGLATHLTSFALSLLHLPHLSPLGETDQAPILAPDMVTVLIMALLMGLGDAAFNTQVISLVSSQYTTNSAEAFALVKLVQSVGVSAGFGVSTRLGLHWQLLVLTISATAGAIGFIMVEREARKRNNEKEISDGDEK